MFVRIRRALYRLRLGAICFEAARGRDLERGGLFRLYGPPPSSRLHDGFLSVPFPIPLNPEAF
jgi:hypothetical protein